MTFGVVIIWIGLSIACGMLAKKQGRGFGGWLALSLLLSPLLGFVVLLVMGNKEAEDSGKEGHRNRNSADEEWENTRSH